CETTIQHSIIKWRNNLDKGKLTGIIFVDFARAFETINRKKLLKILFKLGIRDTALVYMIIHDQRTKNVRNSCNLVLNGQILKSVTETKYLGVIIDDNLTFKRNVE
ncbi:Protein of unknown function, partial [Cotesia congregata]